MGIPIGIDLGTTNSAVNVWRGSSLESVRVDGSPTMPSVVSFKPNGEILVGKQALSRCRIDPSTSVHSSKRWIGDGITTWTIHDHVYTPKDIAVIILRKLKDAATDHLGMPVTSAVVTTPAYFTNNQIRDTKLAAEEAGLNVLQIIPEPTAAAISYGLDKGKDQTILVYDLGGGTFDVSILRIRRNHFVVVAVSGDSHLGGNDLDTQFATNLLDRIGRENPSIPEIRQIRSVLDSPQTLGNNVSLPVRVALDQILTAAEHIKIELSEADSAVVTLIDFLGTHFEARISHDTYNSVVRSLIDRTIALVHKVIADANMSAGDIGRIVLCGGSTRLPLIRDLLCQDIKEPWTSDSVDEAVAQGAAIMARYLTMPAECNLPIEVSNVTPFSLGVRSTLNDDHDAFKILIPKNTPIPCVVTSTFSTFRNNQSAVTIAVYQGENSHCSGNTFIGGFRLDGISPAPAGIPDLHVKFTMNDSALLEVSAVCQSASKTQTLAIHLVSKEDVSAQPNRTADVMIMIDTSGSMASELESVKQDCIGFANAIERAGANCRLGLLDFDKAPAKPYKWKLYPLSTPRVLRDSIAHLNIGTLGGMGCYVGAPDTIPVFEAYVKCFSDADRTRVGILISDEVGNDAPSIQKIIDILRTSDITMYVVGVKGSCHEAIANETGGAFWDIEAGAGRVDMTRVLDSIADEITYLVQK